MIEFINNITIHGRTRGLSGGDHFAMHGVHKNVKIINIGSNLPTVEPFLDCSGKNINHLSISLSENSVW